MNETDYESILQNYKKAVTDIFGAEPKPITPFELHNRKRTSNPFMVLCDTMDNAKYSVKKTEWYPNVLDNYPLVLTISDESGVGWMPGRPYVGDDRASVTKSVAWYKHDGYHFSDFFYIAQPKIIDVSGFI